jgi:hypothetical protein
MDSFDLGSEGRPKESWTAGAKCWAKHEVIPFPPLRASPPVRAAHAMLVRYAVNVKSGFRLANPGRAALSAANGASLPFIGPIFKGGSGSKTAEPIGRQPWRKKEIATIVCNNRNIVQFCLTCRMDRGATIDLMPRSAEGASRSILQRGCTSLGHAPERPLDRLGAGSSRPLRRASEGVDRVTVFSLFRRNPLKTPDMGE